MCLMRDGTMEYKLIDEFDLMPFKITQGLIDHKNNFLFNIQKIYYISDIQPKFKNMLKFGIRIKRTNPAPPGLRTFNNEGFLEVNTLHTQLMKPVNDIIVQTL